MFFASFNTACRRLTCERCPAGRMRSHLNPLGQHPLSHVPLFAALEQKPARIYYEN